MKIKSLILAIGLSLTPVSAVADIAETLRSFDHGTAAEKSIVKGLIKASADGFAVANWRLKNNGAPPLFCEPEKITLTGEQLIDILRRWVDANRDKAPRIDTAPPVMALLFALEDAFPCGK